MKKLIFSAALILLTAGCATTNQHVLDEGTETQLQRRSYQSRIFETTDKEKVLRAAISTLQDLGFVIERADLTLGSISGTKLAGHQVRITVSVRPRGKESMLVRANAQFNVRAVEDPKQYQNFFNSLERSLFLTAHADQ